MSFILSRRKRRREPAQHLTGSNLPRRHHLVLLLVCLCLLPLAASVTDKDALVLLYDATAGDNWRDKTDWKSSKSICNWHGILCDSRKRVTRIDLKHNNLNGKLPPEVWQMPQLKQLLLSNNLLTSLSLEGLQSSSGRAPIEILTLSENHITDITGIGQAKDTLKDLNINKNQIDTTIPDEIFDLTGLETLYLAFNQFEGSISTFIGKISKLTELYAFDNRLTGQIPSEIGLLDQVSVLGLGNNLLTGPLPTEMNNMVNIRDLSIHHVLSHIGNGASTEPKGLTGPLLNFGDMPFLTLLFLDGNSFTGSIPPDFLRHNRLTKQPVTVGLTGNVLTGTLPKSLERFDALSIDLMGNRIEDIPDELCEKGGWMGGLVEEYKCDAILCPIGTYNDLGRSYSSRNPCLPCEGASTPYMGGTECASETAQQDAWKTLAEFYLAMAGEKWTNRIGWEIFDTLVEGGTLEDLEHSQIDACAGWWGITCDTDGQITQIALSHNEMFGTVPDEIFTISTLQSLDLSNNNVHMRNLQGAAGAESLSRLMLSNVKVQDLDGIAELSSLETLYLDGMDIQGPLPDGLFALTALKTLQLQHGHFTGSIPTQIEQLESLENLNMYGNALAGELPTELGSLTLLQSLDLSENKFTGALPTELGSLSLLSTLSIHQTEGDANLSGHLPAFDSFPHLFELNLNSNQFTGSIPDTFLSGVENKQGDMIVSLVHNQLTGSIPETLAEFKSMVLDLEGNKIASIPQAVCEQSGWMLGEVGRLPGDSKCNAILCPPGTWNDYGKETDESPCSECESVGALPDSDELKQIFGQVSCEGSGRSREKEILDKLYSTTGGRYWNATHENWSKPGVPLCQREGVLCFDSSANEGVRELRMNHFGLRGTIPSEIWELTSARQLAFTRNFVDVSFEGIEKAESLVVLKLSKCHLRTLEGLSKVSKKLREIHLAENQFNGTIPSELFELDQVATLFLNNNHFSGRMPSELAKLTGLVTLELWNNRLTGPLPSEFGLLTNLNKVSLSQNGLSGAIPIEIQGLHQLTHFEIAQQNGNGFDGPLPAFDQNPNIISFDASGNGFSGWLPPSFLSRAMLDAEIDVNLSDNDFEGSIPSDWSKFEALTIDLSGNRVTEIPDELCKMNGWNKGLVGLFGTCDAIMCPPGQYLPFGRQVEAKSPCLACEGGLDSAPYFGTRQCLDLRKLAEQAVLSKFYESTNGTNWLMQENWLDHYSVCTWYGVTCDEDGYVSELNLANNFLKSSKSSIPTVSEVFSLQGLKVLDLKGNQVELDFVMIPAGSKLEFLRLSGTGLNSMSGISRAQPLRALHVTNNEIRSIPEELFQLTGLESLFLSYNNIIGTLSKSIGQLTSLKELYLFGNRLSGPIPTSIGLLTNLTEFVAANNLLTGKLPQEFGDLPNLEQLSVHDQQGLDLITGPLPSFSGAPNLWLFDASDNDFTGPLPDDFLMNSVKTTEKVTLNLRNNELTGTIPFSLSKFQALHIDLADNKIVEIPSELCDIGGWMDGKAELVGNCSAILCPKETFNQFGHQSPGNPCLPCSILRDNEFLGHTRCANFTSERQTLNNLYTSAGGEFWSNSTFWQSEAPICSWEGVFCDDGDLQDSQGITRIRLDANGLSGTLPSEVWTLPSLQYLSVNENPNLIVNFDGIAKASETLEVLYLSGVHMSSVEGISAATALKELHVSENKLKGTFPDELFSLSNTLEALSIGSNMFYGTLPTTLGLMTKLQTLYAVENDFLSTIPSELGLLKGLRVLVLSENLLHGQIPQELSKMPSLQVFAVDRKEKSGPRLSGTLPNFHRLPQLTDLYLQGNAIQGGIPQQFVSASQMVQVIRLGNNLLSGTIPDDIGDIGGVSLELEANRIEGFPDYFCEKYDWMEGAVLDLGCDAVLCPPGTASPLGRAVEGTACTNCTKERVATYYGSLSCDGPPSQREILVNLYYNLDGPNWYRKDFWGSTADVCDWYGVGCMSGEVVIINLRGNNLRGLPGPDLFYLPELRVLWLYSNPLEFSFENIESATKLQDLRLDSTFLHSLRGIGAATSLISFDARFASLRGTLPAEIMYLTNLRSLTLGDNDLSGTLPKAFGSLQWLVNLRLSSNRFTGKLPSFDDLNFLKYIDVSDNALTGPISRDFLTKVSLQKELTVKLSRNQLTGVVPEEFGRFKELTMYATDNRILGVPFTLCGKENWNDGDVGRFGCDAILCKPGSSNQYGRRKTGVLCQVCPSATYFGATTCAFAAPSAASQNTLATVLLLGGLLVGMFV